MMNSPTTSLLLLGALFGSSCASMAPPPTFEGDAFAQVRLDFNT